jgi:dihydropyrimidinase
MSVLIKGGRIVTASDDYVGDVLVEGEQVSLMGASLDVQADRTIDASGKYVLPGAIDPHTHLEMPFGGTITVDDFESGQRSAAFGGTTTHVDFAIQTRGRSFTEGIEEWHGKANGRTLIDYGFHIIVSDLEEGGTLEELATLPDQGITSYKLLMAYKGVFQVSDETLFKVMDLARETGALVMIHGENGDAIDILVKRAVANGNLSPGWHYRTRPSTLEGEATNRAIQLAHVAGAPVYIVHVTCREAVEAIDRARRQGWSVWGESCPQYLLLDETYLDRPDFEGAKYVFSPPLRGADHQPVLWHGIQSDILSVMGTDHCSFTFAEQKRLGEGDFSKIPNGGPGLEDRLVLMHHFGVNEGKITLNRLVELCSTNAAKLFGLYPKKGTIAPGSDADIVIFDPSKRKTISASSHHSACDYNLYEGTEVVGDVETVLLRGTVMIEDGELKSQPGSGKFIRRAKFGEQLTNESAAAVG